MHTFEHKGQNFININGKDFFLIQGYQTSRGGFCFLMVTGKTLLKKEDLPNKNWELLTSKQGREKVQTAYYKNYFRYNTTQTSAKLIFIGGSTEGSYYLTFSPMNRHFGLGVSETHLTKIAVDFVKESQRHHSLSKLSDCGNANCNAVLWELSYFDENDAKRLMGGDE